MAKDNDAPEKKQGAMRMRIKLDDAVAKGTYSNTAFVHHNDTEFVLDFLYAEPHRGQGHVVSRVITNPKAAKRLAMGLGDLVKRYEERFGEISLPSAPSLEPGRFH